MCFSFSLSSSPALTPNTLRNQISTDSTVDEFILWRKGIKKSQFSNLMLNLSAYYFYYLFCLGLPPALLPTDFSSG